MDRNRLLHSAVGMVIGIICFILIRLWYAPGQPGSSAEAATPPVVDADRANTTFLAGDYRTAARLLEGRFHAGNSQHPGAIGFEDGKRYVTSLIRLGAYHEADSVLAILTVDDNESSRMVAWARCALAEVRIRTARFEEASDQLLECAAARTRSPHVSQKDSLEAYFGHLMGFLYHERGDYHQAIAMFQETLQRKARLYGVVSREYAVTLNTMANSTYRLGDLNTALDLHRQVLDIRMATSGASHPDVAGSLGNLGNVFLARGDFGKALSHHRRAIDIWMEVFGDESIDLAFSHHNAGEALLELGEYDAALDHLRIALELKRKLVGEDHPYVGWTCMLMAKAFVRRGNSSEADRMSLEGLRILDAHDMEDHVRYWDALRTRAQVQIALGHTTQAENTLSEAIRLAENHRHPQIIPYLNDLAKMFLDDGNIDQALKTVDRVLAINLGENESRVSLLTGTFRHAAYLREYARSLFVKARILLATGTRNVSSSRYAEAFSLLVRSAEVYETLQTQNTNEFTLERLYREESDVLSFGLDHAFDASAYPGDESPAANVFNLLERRNNNSLYHNLLKAQFTQDLRIPASLNDSTLALYENIVQLERHLGYRDAQGGDRFDPERADLRTRLFEARIRYAEFQESLNESYPALKAFPDNITFATLKETQAFLDGSNQVLLDYRITDRHLTGVLIRHDSVHVVSRHISTSVDSVADRMNRGIRDGIASAYVPAARILYRLLIEPVEDIIGSRDLIVVSDGVMGRIPMEALLTSDPELPLKGIDYGTLAYLVRDRAVSYAYSASLLVHFSASPAKMQPSSLLAVAPVFDRELDLSDDALGFLAVNAADGQDAPVRLPPLPGTVAEVHEIASLFEKTGKGSNRMKTDVILRRNATESTVKHLLNQPYDILHFATHSFTNTLNPAFSGMILSNEDDGEDGILYPSEVLGFQLSAELVVLSSCETGLGLNRPGPSGFAKSFMYAGARNMVVSLWPSDDSGTTRLMSAFYGRYFEGMSVQESLRQAKLELIRNGDVIAKPYFWSGFVHIGPPSRF